MDLIDRQAVNNLQKYRYNCGDTFITCISLRSVNDLPSVKPQPCENVISRQAVDDAIYEYSRSCDVNYSQIMEYIDKIPSVSTEKLESFDKAKSEIRCGENKAYNADFTMGCEYALSVIERMLEEVEE